MPVALEDLDGRRLARAIGAEEGEDFTGDDIQVDPADRFKAAIGHMEIAHADDGGGGLRRLPRGVVSCGPPNLCQPPGARRGNGS